MAGAGAGEGRTTAEGRIASALARANVDRAATEAIRAYGPEILRYALSLCRNSADAGDVFADFGVRLWTALPTFRGATTVRALAYRIVRNAAADFYSDGYRRRRATLSTGLASRLAQSVAASSKVALERDAARLEQIRSLFTEEEQTLLLLRIDRGLSWEQIAEVLTADGRAPTAAALRKRFERLKGKIARKASEEGLLEP